MRGLHEGGDAQNARADAGRTARVSGAARVGGTVRAATGDEGASCDGAHLQPDLCDYEPLDRLERRRLARGVLFLLSRDAGRSPLADAASAALDALDHADDPEIVEACCQKIAIALLLDHDQPESAL
jgi:hypothetical protein